MTAYVELQEREFALEEHGYTPTATSARSAPATSTRSWRPCPAAQSSTLALKGSTEEEQFDRTEEVAHVRPLS